MKKCILNRLIALTMFLVPAFLFSQTPPTLGDAAGFVLFTSNGAVMNVGISQVTGNVGTNVGSSTGFGNVNGQMHDQTGLSASAAFDLNLAYLDLGSQIPTMFPGILLGNDTLFPAVYYVPAASTMTGILTLDGQGDTNACFIFQLDGAFAADPGSSIVLINGTKACNVFWRINGATDLAAGTFFKGTIVCDGAIGLATGDDLEGRALSVSGAVTITGTKATMPLGCGSPFLTGPGSPPLGSLTCYALLTADGALTNTGITTITGDVGTNNGPVSGFNPLLVNGTIHSVPDASTAQGSADLNVLYTYLNGLPFDIELLYPAQFGNGLVLTPHVYRMNAALAGFTDSVFLNAQGNPNAVFVIQVNGALTTSTYSNVVLMNGTQSSNVFWVVEGAVSINDYSTFNGTIVANNGAIELFLGSTFAGRALSTIGAITTHDVTMSITSGPPSITPADSNSLCTGDTLVLTASGGSSYLWSTGDTTQTITVDTAGNYSVIVYSSCGTNDTSSVTTVVLNSLPGIGYTVSPNDTICVGGSVTLSGTGSTSYSWSGGITNGVSFNPVSSGNYTVTSTDTTACNNSAIASIFINPFPTVGYTATPNDTVCNDVTLSGTGANTYLWTGGVINGIAFIPSLTTYTVTGSDVYGCSNTAVANIVLGVNPIVNLGSDIVQANPPVVLDAGAGFVFYLWSTSASTQTISVNTNGTYTVTVTNSYGCTDNDTIQVNFTSGIINNNGTQSTMSLYPNPSNGPMNVSIENLETENLVIDVIDMAGKMVYTRYVGSVSGNFVETLDFSDFRTGIYILRMTANGKSVPMRFIINK